MNPNTIQKAKLAARARVWRAANRDKHRSYSKAWREANKEKVKSARRSWYLSKGREYHRAWRANNPVKRRGYHQSFKDSHPHYYIENRYGISIVEYKQMLDTQNNKCAICRKSFRDSKSTCIDHCHKVGHVRGLLCRYCNSWIGYIGESPATMRRALEYLSKEILFSRAA
jgi:hypothetical protein